jgi:hypothetical protein
MVIFSAEGMRSVDVADVACVYRGSPMPGGYTQCAVVLDNGTEISGMAMTAALDELEQVLAGDMLPPAA